MRKFLWRVARVLPWPFLPAGLARQKLEEFE